MEMKQFAQTVQATVQKELGQGYEIAFHDVSKNNGVTLTGLTITAKGQNIAPTIYLDSFHEAYEGGVSLTYIVQKILEIYGKDAPPQSIDMEFFKDFEKVKDRICYRLINREKNEKLLSQIPHREFLDLEICFYYAYQGEKLGNGTILIFNNHLEMWGTTAEELFALAQKNTPVLFPWECKTIEEALREIRGETDEDSAGQAKEERGFMKILGNSAHVYGAACILYPGVLEELARKEGRNYYILPSSVHEVILLEEEAGENRELLKEMIKEVNDTQVSLEEILSYQLYYFDCADNHIRIF
ncbi:MAG: DUF5688 family protein [Bacteroidales bacterium]|nr:DUF5688 family protein [Lachnoclostridium sp.]MCM1383691.1 DUF5688 family protein [Lachnoclostridium sp.]MCM1466360.1 DUF5688 family protein [Bacteroidales bacterium]